MKTEIKGMEKKLTKLVRKVRKVFPYADIETVQLSPLTTFLKPRVEFVIDCRPEESGSVMEYDFKSKNYFYDDSFYKRLKDLKKAYENSFEPCGKRKRKTYKISAYKIGKKTQVITKMKEMKTGVSDGR